MSKESSSEYLSILYSLYSDSALSDRKNEIMRKFVDYPNYSEIFNFLSFRWFSQSSDPVKITEYLKFLVLFVYLAKENQKGDWSLYPGFLLKFLSLNPIPTSYHDYSKFLIFSFKLIKEINLVEFYNQLTNLPPETFLFPAVHFSLINTNFLGDIYSFLFSILKKPIPSPLIIPWFESAFILFSAHPNIKIDELASFSDLDAALSISNAPNHCKLFLLSSISSFFPVHLSLQLMKIHFEQLLKQINDSKSSSSAFRAGLTFIKLIEEEKTNNNVEFINSSIVTPIFTFAIPFLGKKDKAINECLSFCKYLKPEILQSNIVAFIKNCTNSINYPCLFLISHFPSEKTISTLFGPVSAQLRSIQYSLILSLIRSYPQFGLKYLFDLFSVLKATDYYYLDYYFQQHQNLYMNSFIQYLWRSIDSGKISYVSHLLSQQSSIISIKPPNEVINNALLTLIVQYFLSFDKPRLIQDIASLIEYIKFCKTCASDSVFNYSSHYSQLSFLEKKENKVNSLKFINKTLKEFSDELVQLSLSRVKIQEKYQAFSLAALAKDECILINCVYMLNNDISLLPLFFSAAATNFPISKLIKPLQQFSISNSSSKGFLSSIFSSPIIPSQIKLDTILQCIAEIAPVSGFSDSLYQILIDNFYSSPKLTLAIISICDSLKSNQDKYTDLSILLQKILSIKLDANSTEKSLSSVLSMNNQLSESLAQKIATFWINFIITEKILRPTEFEKAFFSQRYASITIPIYTSLLDQKLQEREGCEPLFHSLQTFLYLNVIEINFFERFFSIFIQNSLSPNLWIRSFSIDSLKYILKISIAPPSNIQIHPTYEYIRFLQNLFATVVSKLSFGASEILCEVLLQNINKALPTTREAIFLFLTAVIHHFRKSISEEINNNNLIKMTLKNVSRYPDCTTVLEIIINDLCQLDDQSFFNCILECSDLPRKIVKILFQKKHGIELFIFDFISHQASIPISKIQIQQLRKCLNLLTFYVENNSLYPKFGQIAFSIVVSASISHLLGTKSKINKTNSDNISAQVLNLSKLLFQNENITTLTSIDVDFKHFISDFVSQFSILSIDTISSFLSLLSRLSDSYYADVHFIVLHGILFNQTRPLLPPQNSIIEDALSRFFLFFTDETIPKEQIPYILSIINPETDIKKEIFAKNPSAINDLLILVSSNLSLENLPLFEKLIELVDKSFFSEFDNKKVLKAQNVITALKDLIMEAPDLFWDNKIQESILKFIQGGFNPEVFVSVFNYAVLTYGVSIINHQNINNYKFACTFFEMICGREQKYECLFKLYKKSSGYLKFANICLKVLQKKEKIEAQEIKEISEIMKPIINRRNSDSNCRATVKAFICDIKKISSKCDDESFQIVLDIIQYLKDFQEVC